jgi:2-oxoglutarate/2-oxoacid ferredoxin oxidoreductase subunit beta
LHPLSVAIGAEATFVARSLDSDAHHMASMLLRAHEHRGTSFVEVYQNCNIFNDGAFKDFTAKEVRADRMIFLEHGQPMLFGKEKDKGLRINAMKMEVVQLGNGITEADLLVHDETREDPSIAFLLSRMDYPEYPVPVGVIRAVRRPTYDELMTQQIDLAIATEGEGDLKEILHEGDTWTVE